ncbi:MAG: rhodanese-like domain-containing protein [Nitrosomonadales bacterium]|nr:rhodanese-like domain-containing protein [Nitrosomonadales bacterium]
MTGIQKCIVALAVLVLAGCGPKAEQWVDVKAAAERQAQGELILDVREADDYKEFHIPTSMNMPFGRLSSQLAELEPYRNKTIMVIDHAEQRAPRALEQLQKAGFTRVLVVKGGMAEWKAAGLPIEKLDMKQPPPQ